MKAEAEGTLTASLLNRLSSGTKMLFIMTVALMPLGLIALFASIQSAHGKRLQHESEARVVAASEARQIDLTVLRGANVIRLAAIGAHGDPRRCTTLIDDAERVLRGTTRVALFAPDGRLLCATRGFDARALPPPRGQIGVELLLLPAAAGIRFTVGASDRTYAVGELSREVLRDTINVEKDRQSVALRQGDARLQLLEPAARRPFDRRVTVSAPIAGGQVNLISTSVTNSISAIEVLLVLLPLLMWAAAAAIGWIVVNELLLRPLGQLQRAVAASDAEGGFTLPRLSTPAREIRTLGRAFADATARIAHRESELGEAFSRQVKLTREVHHRVKNNLQVVASLINLHARGTSGEVAGAYASIQRRVDALAIVHRNHFAELEENRGVALRALIAELTGNLRATAPVGGTQLAITLDMAPAHVSQDVAVPVAFLVTEIVELVMQCAPIGAVEIALTSGQVPDRAILTIHAPGLARDVCREHATRDRFERIVAGLARQLRAPLDADAATGSYGISIAIVPDSD